MHTQLTSFQWILFLQLFSPRLSKSATCIAELALSFQISGISQVSAPTTTLIPASIPDCIRTSETNQVRAPNANFQPKFNVFSHIAKLSSQEPGNSKLAFQDSNSIRTHSTSNFTSTSNFILPFPAPPKPARPSSQCTSSQTQNSTTSPFTYLTQALGYNFHTPSAGGNSTSNFTSSPSLFTFPMPSNGDGSAQLLQDSLVSLIPNFIQFSPSTTSLAGTSSQSPSYGDVFSSSSFNFNCTTAAFNSNSNPTSAFIEVQYSQLPRDREYEPGIKFAAQLCPSQAMSSCIGGRKRL